MKTFCTVLVSLILLVGVSSAQKGKFQSFGAARLVTGGVRPDSAVFDLTSNCGAQPYSNTCYSASQFTYSGVAFTFNKNNTTLAGITTLSTDYNFGGADCGGGSPRFVIYTTTSDTFEGYFGPPPNFTNCYYGWLNTGNETSDSTARWVVNNGNTYYTWSQLVANYGTDVVPEIDIVLDGGWITPKGQDLSVDTFTVNNNVLRASITNVN